MKLTLDKTKLLSILKGAGAVIADDKTAEAVATAINSLIPDDDFLTSKEVDDKLHEVREEAKARREVIDNLVKTITGKERNEFDEKDRSKKMLEAVNAELETFKTKTQEYEEKFAPLQEKLSKYETAEKEKFTNKWTEINPKLEAIFADEENSKKYKSKFVLPEEGKELDEESIIKNVQTFSELQELGVPVFVESDEAEEPEQNNNPKSKSGNTTPKGRSREEYLKNQAALGLL